MPVMRPLREKPGGARDVLSWDIQVRRAIPVNPDRDVPRYWVEIEAHFATDEAMLDFEARVRALLPEGLRFGWGPE